MKKVLMSLKVVTLTTGIALTGFLASPASASTSTPAQPAPPAKPAPPGVPAQPAPPATPAQPAPPAPPGPSAAPTFGAATVLPPRPPSGLSFQIGVVRAIVHSTCNSPSQTSGQIAVASREALLNPMLEAAGLPGLPSYSVLASQDPKCAA